MNWRERLSDGIDEFAWLAIILTLLIIARWCP